MWDLVEKKTKGVGREKIKEGGEEMRGREKRKGRASGFLIIRSRRWECRPLKFYKNQKPTLGVPAIGIF